MGEILGWCMMFRQYLMAGRHRTRERAWNDQACFPRPLPGCPVHLRIARHA